MIVRALPSLARGNSKRALTYEPLPLYCLPCELVIAMGATSMLFDLLLTFNGGSASPRTEAINFTIHCDAHGRFSVAVCSTPRRANLRRYGSLRRRSEAWRLYTYDVDSNLFRRFSEVRFGASAAIKSLCAQRSCSTPILS